MPKSKKVKFHKVKSDNKNLSISKTSQSIISDNKISYYSIDGHRAVLWFYAIFTLLISVAFFIFILRLFFWAFTFIPPLNIGSTDKPDYSYLADFLGGLIGVVIGFFADSMFISRLQHLKRYKSQLNLLNKELNDVKNIIKFIWGVETITYNDSIIRILKAVGILNDKNEIIFNKIDKIGRCLEKYDNNEDAFYESLYSALKEVFTNSDILKEIRQNARWMELNEKVKIYELKSYFDEDSFKICNIQFYRLALSYCLTLDMSKITKLSIPILENIVTSPEGIATFYNLPRYTIWSEEQGNFARELQYFYHTIETFELNFKNKSSWEFITICKDLIDRIDKFQKATDIQYYHTDICNYLKPILDTFSNEQTDKEIFSQLKGKEFYGLRIRKLKNKNFIFNHPIISNLFFLSPFLKPNINKNYFRYKLVLKPTNSCNKLPHGYVKYDNYKILRKRFTLRFERKKYLSPNLEEYSLKDFLLAKVDVIFETQSALSMALAHEQREAKKQKLSSFAFSSKYFSAGIKKFISDSAGFEATDYLDDECLEILSNNSVVQSELDKISKIFKDITTIPSNYNYKNTIKTKILGELNILDENLDRGIQNVILKNYDKNNNKSGIILKISSPIGSYKNRLLQYIYLNLKLNKEFKNENVFYIDLSKYENEFDTNSIEDDFTKIEEIVSQRNENHTSTKLPLFIFDNVREFHCGINNLYSLIFEFLKTRIKNYKLILGCDKLYTLNPEQQEKLVFDDFISYKTTIINISSMNITREEECLEFISNCMSFVWGNINNIDTKKMHKELMNLNFYTLDAYWLIKILKQTNNLKDNSKNILNLYDIGLFKYTAEMGKKQYDDLAKSVYSFEYESQHFDTVQLRNSDWKLAREHRSMIDYLVARHYVVLLRETILPKDEYLIIQNLGGKLNLFLPKSVNRFIVRELSKNDIHNLILFCEKNIDIINKYPKFECQVTYILRILGKEYLEYLSDSINILNTMLKHSQEHELVAHYNDAEIRQQLFLSRCIVIGLGYLGNFEEFSKYLKTIINLPENLTHNDIADDINRAFHLDYYGDTYKCLDLNGGFGNYMDDDKEKGVNALRKLQIDIRRDIAKYTNKDFDDGKKAILILQMVTYCSLMKARNYEFKSLINKEDFITPIHENIRKLEQQIKSLEFKDKFFNNENGYLIDFLLQVLQDVCRKVNSK